MSQRSTIKKTKTNKCVKTREKWKINKEMKRNQGRKIIKNITGDYCNVVLARAKGTGEEERKKEGKR